MMKALNKEQVIGWYEEQIQITKSYSKTALFCPECRELLTFKETGYVCEDVDCSVWDDGIVFNEKGEEME